ncbi:hypothetical protein ACLESD_27910, partial [Pyxidicoccus sp. 3LFB2]
MRRRGGCGNGRLDTGETCDDGNRRADDGCNAPSRRLPHQMVERLATRAGMP